MCAFPAEGESRFAPPEIIKTRPVVVVSRHKKGGAGTCTVVPLSTTPPKPIEPWHIELTARGMPDHYKGRWAKCDLITNVSFKRLFLFKVKFRGQWVRLQGTLPYDEYMKIIEAIKQHLRLI